MYSPSNLARFDTDTSAAKSESDPHWVYFIRHERRGHVCACPAGTHGRHCKHLKALERALRIASALRLHRPEPRERCRGSDGWCSYPHLALWFAVGELAFAGIVPSLDEIAREAGEPTLSADTITAMRPMYACS